jgi:hypothetical protein
MENQHHQERHARLQDLAAKSWNLELIISGAAIYLVSQMPDAIDGLFRYYLDNLVLDTNYIKIQLPLLAYGFAKVVSWVLIGTFVVHFAIRAFWVGLVGLHAVYPDGIQYDRLPGKSTILREYTKKQFGQLSDYVVRLDRLGNQVFSFAFLIALLGFGICLAYLFIFAVTNLLPVLVGEQKGKWVTIGISLLIMLVAMIPLAGRLLAMNKKLEENQSVRKFTAWATYYGPAIFMPIVYKPMSYINLTYSSNVSRWRLYTVMAVVFLIVFSGVFWVFVKVLDDLKGRGPMTTQTYYARGMDEHSLVAARYENLRAENEPVSTVSIPSDVVEGPMLRVFVSYPKYLDASLSHFCTTPELPAEMPKSIRIHQADSLHLQCMDQFFRLSVNDSLYRNPGWLFYRHPQTGTRGLMAYIPTTGFLPGKNVLRVRIPAPEKPDSLMVYGVVPFYK